MSRRLLKTDGHREEKKSRSRSSLFAGHFPPRHRRHPVSTVPCGRAVHLRGPSVTSKCSAIDPFRQMIGRSVNSLTEMAKVTGFHVAVCLGVMGKIVMLKYLATHALENAFGQTCVEVSIRLRVRVQGGCTFGLVSAGSPGLQAIAEISVFPSCRRARNAVSKN